MSFSITLYPVPLFLFNHLSKLTTHSGVTKVQSLSFGSHPEAPDTLGGIQVVIHKHL